MRIAAGVVVVVVGMGVSVGAHAQRWRDDTATTIGDTAEWTNKVELADVDGDGWLDVVLANGAGYASPGPAEASRVFRNTADWTGAGPFFAEITGEVFGTATAHTRVIEVRDLDGDDDNDLFVGNTFGDASRLYRKDPGGWTDVSAAQLPAGSPRVGDADVGDVDADGDLDLVLADWGASLDTGAPPRLYLNDGAGTFTDATATHVPPGNVAWSWELDLADVDGDFDLDLLVASKLGAHSVLYRNDGAGHFTDASAGLPAFANNYETEVMDVDGDGDVDLVTLNDGANLRDHLFINDGTGVFTDETAARISGAANPAGADDNMAAFIDIDSDRDPDLLIGSLSDPDRLLINDGAGVFTLEPGAVPGSSPGTLGIAFGDVDHDDRPDLLMGQGEAAEPDFLYRAVDSVPLDGAAPLITLQQIGEGSVQVRARVSDGKTPVTELDLTEVVLEYTGDATGNAAMAWSGELLWSAALPAAGSYQYRVCATDNAGNRDCSAYKLTAGGGDVTPPGNDAVRPPDAAGAGGDGDGGGCCNTGESPPGSVLLIGLVALALRRRRRAPR